MTTFGQSDVQKQRLLDYRYLQPAQGGQLTLMGSGQGHRLFHLRHIQDEISFILSATEKISSKDDFVNDETLKGQLYEVSKSLVKLLKRSLPILN